MLCFLEHNEWPPYQDSNDAVKVFKGIYPGRLGAHLYRLNRRVCFWSSKCTIAAIWKQGEQPMLQNQALKNGVASCSLYIHPIILMRFGS